MEYKMNAQGKILGRLASEVAMVLRGKNSPKFSPARLSQHKVCVYNTDQILVSGRKLTQKIYRHHSGFHGGLKEERLKDVLVRDSRLVVARAVAGMLPKNKLRPRMLKNLLLFRGEKK